MNRVLIEPIISEKSMQLATQGWYTFKVDPKSTKPAIAQAVASQFNVSVVAVKSMVYKGTAVRTGRKRTEGISSPWKKAVVKLKKDQKIEIFNFSTGNKG